MHLPLEGPRLSAGYERTVHTARGHCTVLAAVATGFSGTMVASTLGGLTRIHKGKHFTRFEET